ncbi:hypothetical protein P2Q70_16965 [Pseudomonas mendocina]|uniref:hypothetical protein n=1 Tax=Ectopseudomonas mendocina TaxID=300 RepID=UPI0023DA3E75|nr:hypothetical protein [Pseudomonas mendocina]MDF2076274.1 hypothetical protein [Pseudomonas mendocina]
MADAVSVNGPVRVVSDANARVAYDLMLHIASWESVEPEAKKNREYWLTLYRQAHKAVAGYTLEKVLPQD